MQRLDESAHLLDNMHMPWQQNVDELTDINASLRWAIAEIFPETRFQGQQSEVVTHDGITVQLNLTDNMLQVMTVPDMLTEAFRVVIKNGLDAIRESGRKKSVLSIRSIQQEDKKSEIQVEDNGIGIQAENLGKIFDLGWSSKEGQGMGFGLFWARDYIEGLGGNIKCRSTYKKGTTFFITLPAGDVPL